MLLLPNVSFVYAAPFPANVANDVYGVAQGGAVNGIPTANDDNDGIPDINDALNLLTGGAVAQNVGYDNLFLEPDELWHELGISGEVALIGLTAGNQNTVGVYTDIGTGAVQTVVLATAPGSGFAGDGTIALPFPAGMTGLAPGQNYGWYLDSTSGSGTNTFFSESALNPFQLDHMMTFDLSVLSGTVIYIDFGAGAVPLLLGTDTFLIAWEDLPFNTGTQTLGDDDYDDMMYIVTSVNPSTFVGGEIIPIETTALILAGAQTFSWMIPVALSVLGIGLFVVSRKI